MARPRKPGPRTASGRLSRAARRNAERAIKNLLARGVAIEQAEEPPKRRCARTKSALELLEGRGAISGQQKQAGDRLARDYAASNTTIGRLTSSYEPRAGSRGRWQQVPDTPRSCAARERYDNALRAVGPWLSEILIHVAVCDESASAWGPMNGRAATDGVPVLRLALDALAAHYRGDRRQAA